MQGGQFRRPDDFVGGEVPLPRWRVRPRRLGQTKAALAAPETLTELGRLVDVRAGRRSQETLRRHRNGVRRAGESSGKRRRGVGAGTEFRTAHGRLTCRAGFRARWRRRRGGRHLSNRGPAVLRGGGPGEIEPAAIEPGAATIRARDPDQYRDVVQREAFERGEGAGELPLLPGSCHESSSGNVSQPMYAPNHCKCVTQWVRGLPARKGDCGSDYRNETQALHGVCTSVMRALLRWSSRIGANKSGP